MYLNQCLRWYYSGCPWWKSVTKWYDTIGWVGLNTLPVGYMALSRYSVHCIISNITPHRRGVAWLSRRRRRVGAGQTNIWVSMCTLIVYSCGRAPRTRTKVTQHYWYLFTALGYLTPFSIPSCVQQLSDDSVFIYIYIYIFF